VTSKRADRALADEVIVRNVASQQRWSQIPINTRGAVLEHVDAMLRSHVEDFTVLGMATIPKIKSEMLGSIKEGEQAWTVAQQQVAASENIHHQEVQESSEPERQAQGYKKILTYKPYGSTAFILPGNFPYACDMWGFYLALLQGNSRIALPDERNPLISYAMAKVVTQALARFDARLEWLAPMINADAAIKSFICGHDSISLIQATGSPAMGRAVANVINHSNNPGKKYIPELGGNGALLVGKDMDTKETGEIIAEALFATSGMRCTTGRRGYIPREIFSEVVSSVIDRLNKVQIGDVFDSATTMGPLIGGARAVDAYLACLKEYIEAGGELVSGGRVISREQGLVEPAVFIFDKPNDVILSEHFVPVLALMPFDYGKDGRIPQIVFDHVNGRGEQVFKPYGLSNSILSHDPVAVADALRNIRSGHVNVRMQTGGQETGLFGGEGLTGGGRMGDSREYVYRTLSVVRPVGAKIVRAQGVQYEEPHTKAKLASTAESTPKPKQYDVDLGNS
jgi:acyl-CoA reductase-like NAD-dependent aldehyde dehydrogenase